MKIILALKKNREMKRVGAYMAVIGLASLLLPFFGLELRFLSALDEMGTTGIIIKVALIAVGAFLFLRKTEPTGQESADNTELKE